jgi:hypothetical protein
MRMLISLLVVLSLSIIGLPGLQSTGHAAVASGATPVRAVHGGQGRTTNNKKKRRTRPAKVKKTEKKSKKNDRGFEL